MLNSRFLGFVRSARWQQSADYRRQLAQDGDADCLTLAQARQGDRLIVQGSTDCAVALQAIRFGIGSGAEITVCKKIPGGPVIVSRNQQEIAIGQDLASSILVLLEVDR